MNPKSLKNLVDRSAPDRPGVTIPKGVRLRPDQVEALAKLNGDRSWHIRQAIDLYLDSLKAL